MSKNAGALYYHIVDKPGGERYLFIYDEAHRVDMFRAFGRYASDPELSFDWKDATKLAKEYEDISDDKRDAIARRGRHG